MSDELQEKIRNLDDASALSMLSLITEAHQEPGQQETPSRELAEAMNKELDGTCEAATDPEDGEAARLALMLLAEDERFRGPIEAMIKGPTPELMGLGVVEGTLLAAALIFALQTHFKFERKEDGRWSIKLEKKPTNNALLTPLVKKLLSITGL